MLALTLPLPVVRHSESCLSPKQGYLLHANLLSYFKKSVVAGALPFGQLLATRESRESTSPCPADVIPDRRKGMYQSAHVTWLGVAAHCISPLEIANMLRNPQSDLSQAWSPGVPGLGPLTLARGAGARLLSPLLATADSHRAGSTQRPCRGRNRTTSGVPLGVCGTETWLGPEASGDCESRFRWQEVQHHR